MWQQKILRSSGQLTEGRIYIYMCVCVCVCDPQLSSKNMTNSLEKIHKTSGMLFRRICCTLVHHSIVISHSKKYDGSSYYSAIKNHFFMQSDSLASPSNSISTKEFIKLIYIYIDFTSFKSAQYISAIVIINNCDAKLTYIGTYSEANNSINKVSICSLEKLWEAF